MDKSTILSRIKVGVYTTLTLAMLADAALGIRSCKMWLDSKLPQDVKKEMDIGVYHVVARDEISRILEIYNDGGENFRPALTATDRDYDRRHPSVHPRFEEINLSYGVPVGDSLETYVNLQKLEILYNRVMVEGRIAK